MSKFKKGDHIKAVSYYRGFDEATVLDTFISKDGKFKGQEMYLLKIMCGTATMPVRAEVNYELKKKK